MGGIKEYFIAPLGCPALPPLRAGVALQGGSGFPAADRPGLVPRSDQSFVARLVRLFGGRWCRVWCVLCPLCPCRRCGLSLVAAASGPARACARGLRGRLGRRGRLFLLRRRRSARGPGGSSPPPRVLAGVPPGGVRRLWARGRWLFLRRVRRGCCPPCCARGCVSPLGLRPGPACPVSRPPVPPCSGSGRLCGRGCVRLVPRCLPGVAVVAWLVAVLRLGCARARACLGRLRLLWPAAAPVRLGWLAARALPAGARWCVRVALVPGGPWPAVSLVRGVARGCFVVVARLWAGARSWVPARVLVARGDQRASWPGDL